MAAAQLGFFFQYMDGTSVRLMETPYIPGVETGYFAVVAGVGSVLITTMILMGALLLLMRRWTLPFGAGLVLFGGFGLLMELLEGFDYRQELIAPLVAGLAVDLLVRTLRPGADRPASLRILAFAVPVVMWIVHFGHLLGVRRDQLAGVGVDGPHLLRRSGRGRSQLARVPFPSSRGDLIG